MTLNFGKQLAASALGALLATALFVSAAVGPAAHLV
jgi:hypothetical protein